MAIQVMPNSEYHQGAKRISEPRVATTTNQEPSLTTINLTEITITSKVADSNQTGKGQNSTQNNEQNDRQKQGAAGEKQIKNAISQANNKLRTQQRTRCEFSYHEESKRVSIKVVDEDTQEVIREIPSEQTLELVEKIWELQGLVVDKRR